MPAHAHTRRSRWTRERPWAQTTFLANENGRSGVVPCASPLNPEQKRAGSTPRGGGWDREQPCEH